MPRNAHLGMCNCCFDGVVCPLHPRPSRREGMSLLPLAKPSCRSAVVESSHSAAVTGSHDVTSAVEASGCATRTMPTARPDPARQMHPIASSSSTAHPTPFSSSSSACKILTAPPGLPLLVEPVEEYSKGLSIPRQAASSVKFVASTNVRITPVYRVACIES